MRAELDGDVAGVTDAGKKCVDKASKATHLPALRDMAMAKH
jgi:hypothetical protein